MANNAERFSMVCCHPQCMVKWSSKGMWIYHWKEICELTTDNSTRCPAKWVQDSLHRVPVMQKTLPCHDVIMKCQPGFIMKSVTGLQRGFPVKSWGFRTSCKGTLLLDLMPDLVNDALKNDGCSFQLHMIRNRLYKLRQNGHYFTDDIFKLIFFNENVCILTWIVLQFVPSGTINKSALVQIMARCQTGTKPLSESMMA